MVKAPSGGHASGRQLGWYSNPHLPVSPKKPRVLAAGLKAAVGTPGYGIQIYGL